MNRCIMFVLLTVLLLLVPAFKLSGAEKRAFTIDDLYRIKSISGLELSPRGNWLLFSVRESNLKKGSSASSIYLMNLKNKTVQRITQSEKSDYHPFWSQEGNKIYFLSNRREGTQLWQMNIDGGEPRKISNFRTGVYSPVIAPRGKIYFTSTVFPECMADDACNKRMADKLENGNVQAHMADSLLYRHWDAYRDWQYTHLFCLDTLKKKVQPVTEGHFDYPAYSLGGGPGYDLSPDGKTVCIVSNHDENPEHSTNSDLLLFDCTVPGFKTRNITKENLAFDGSPSFSPDGKSIAYFAQKIPGYESDKMRLAVYKLKTGKTTVLTETIDYWVSDFKWGPGSAYIYFTLDKKGYTPLYRVNIKTRKIETLLLDHVIREFQVTPGGKQVIFTHSSVGSPVEVWSYEVGKKKAQPERLTFFNKELEDAVDIRPAEPHWVKGDDNKKIHLFVVKPHNFDPAKKYPLILNIHGGPQMQWTDSFRGDWQVYPGAGYVVAFCNPHGSTGYGQEFTRAISRDWNGRVMEDVEAATLYLASFPYIDAKRMGAMGWSWGGYAVMWLEGHNKYFQALASMMGIYDARGMYSGTEELWFPKWDFGKTPWEDPQYYRDISPSSYVKNFKTPCLIITGERDYRVPYNHSLEFFTDLREMKVPARLIVFKNDGHWPSQVKSMPVYYNAHLEWFHRYLGGGKAPYDTEKMIRNLAFDEKDDKKNNKESN